MKRKISLLSCLVAVGFAVLVFWPGSGLKADDRDIFSASTKPYIMFLLDTSSSMQAYDYIVAADEINSFKSYTLSTASGTDTYTLTQGGNNGRDPQGDFYYKTNNQTYYATRNAALKRVVIELLDVFRNDVKMGYAHYLYKTETQTPIGDGAVIRTGISDFSGTTNDAALKTLCDQVFNIYTGFGTPLAESLDTMYGYFAGNKISISDGNTWIDKNSNTRIPAGALTPTQYTCQNTHVIFVSDGEPTTDNFASGYAFRYTPSTAGTTLPGIAGWMFNEKFPAISGGTTSHGIQTWTVGMKLGSAGATLLSNTATAGGGEYFPGDDYAELRTKLTGAIGAIIEQNYAFTAYTSPKKITTAEDESYVSYQGFFFNKPNTVPIWEGHLKCLEIVPQGNTYKFVEQWDAAAKLKTLTEPNRNLWTEVANEPDATTNISYTPVLFKNTSASTLRRFLNVSTDTEAGTIIDYIRGNMTTRNITDPQEQYLLADIFHSDVIYVGKPFAWKSLYDTLACDKADASNDTDCYKNFYLAKAARQKVVYVGTNDGVIHQFNADMTGTDAGKELRGFIPDKLLPKLKRIAIDNFFTYTADGRMTAADIYSPANKWQTTLTYGLRDGGKSFGCFNISDPAAVSFKWKFPAPDVALYIHNFDAGNHVCNAHGAFHFGGLKVENYFYPGQIICNVDGTACTKVLCIDNGWIAVESTAGFALDMQIFAMPSISQYMGYTWCKPVVGRLKYKKGTTGTETEGWVTIVTGGRGNDADATSNEGKALFILDADTGNVIWYLAHTSGSNDINNDHYITNTALRPELNYSVPQSLTAVDLDNDTFIDTIYFGNTGGHLFKLDLSDSLTTSWIPKHMFQGDSTKPIYMSPSVSYDQCYGLWLHFGSGDRNNPQDCATGQFIAMRDEKTTTYPLTTASLQKLEWTGNVIKEDTTADPTKKGWYFDFLDSAEILFDPDPVVIPNNSVPVLYFNTYQRNPTVAGNPCGVGGNMHVYKITLPYCSTYSSFLISGIRDAGRIAGHGLYGSNSDLMYINTSGTGSITIKEFKESTLQYPGGVIYFKEIVR